MATPPSATVAMVTRADGQPLRSRSTWRSWASLASRSSTCRRSAAAPMPCRRRQPPFKADTKIFNLRASDASAAPRPWVRAPAAA
jgi:hypothetical protein